MHSSSFELLDHRVQRWIWSKGWGSLREVQELSIPPILGGTHDVIITASTASGKTEAAFFPILTELLKEESNKSLVVYIGPLKALINDQFNRVADLCDSLEIPVHPWHGDISMSVKNKFFSNPSGILLITPESIEAMFVNRGSQVPKLFARLKYIVIDEMHAFISTERGKQLQSLLHRIDLLLDRTTPRIGLSATLGDIRMGCEFIRPNAAAKVIHVQAHGSDQTLKVQLRSYVEPKSDSRSNASNSGAASVTAARQDIGAHIFKHSRGKNNLIFPNSRSEVEQLTHYLRSRCDELHVPNEYWPHHGSLSKQAREETEHALKNTSTPTTAICTSTLELGIDIGDIDTVFQVGCPPSIASLRQRLGRSGRRENAPAILRGYAIFEQFDAKSSLISQLYEDLFEFTAIITLLLENWFEPPNSRGLHLSTFIQQILSVIAQKGGISAPKAYRDLIETGPFNSLSKTDFLSILRQLGKHELISQDASGLLLLGRLGEVYVNNYSFYSAFQSEEEYRLYNGTELLGTMPIASGLVTDEIIIFSGRTWIVTSVDEDAKVVQLRFSKGGKAPIFISGRIRNTHLRIREVMRNLYEGNDLPRFLDEQSCELIQSGRDMYRLLHLKDNTFFEENKFIYLFTWDGDSVNETIAALLRKESLLAENCGLTIAVSLNHNQTANDIFDVMRHIVDAPRLGISDILEEAQGLRLEKWDWALPDDLVQQSYASVRLDIDRGYRCIERLLQLQNTTPSPSV